MRYKYFKVAIRLSLNFYEIIRIEQYTREIFYLYFNFAQGWWRKEYLDHLNNKEIKR